MLISQGKEVEFQVDENSVMRFRDRVYVPYFPELKQKFLEEDHRSWLSIHLGSTKMYQDLKKIFWWSGMKKDVIELIYSCLTCQNSKIKHQRPSGLMKLLSIPEWKWDNILMDFVTRISRMMKGSDSIWFIVDRLTKSAHLLLIKISYLLQKLAEVYISEIMKLCDIPLSIVSDGDLRFTSNFLTEFSRIFGN